MNQPFKDLDDGEFRFLWEDSGIALYRGAAHHIAGGEPIFLVSPLAENPAPAIMDRLSRELSLQDTLDGMWALRPVGLKRVGGRTSLVLKDPGGELLAGLLGTPMETGRFLSLAADIASALAKVHRCGLVHKDIKPSNIVVDVGDRCVRLTGFGIASRLTQERQAPAPPQEIEGTLAYMSPEQTGRTNHSVDSRSDLYSLGVTLYEMATGTLPFTAAGPMEWVHGHVARQPTPPSKRLNTVPEAVSVILMKLLEKSPEARYQTALGVERDLRRCLSAWQATGNIDNFPPGLHDIPDHLLIPEKLYGRERELAIMVGCLERVVHGGNPELLLVSGYSGIGKSAVVNELHKALLPSRGFFASGKFDQHQRDIPYATLVQALQDLVRQLLGDSDASLSAWRKAFGEALGLNAQLITDLIPELKLVIGEHPPAAELPLQQAQVRFQLVFRRFIGAFARPGHPLVLFLDDLQWVDAGTLDLLEDIISQPESKHLLLICAFRDNEVGAGHPLTRKLDTIGANGGRITAVTLEPLDLHHLIAMISDALRCPTDDSVELAELVWTKTGGNPFFVIQFLYLLADERLLAFDYGLARWSWDIERIKAQGYTDNVVDLMVGKLARLSQETRDALMQMSCLGNVVDLATLSLVLEADAEAVYSVLWPARGLALVERTSTGFRFTHDRVQEAAYSLLPEILQAEAHLRIGRLMAARTPEDRQAEAIFDIVNQLNRGVALINSPDERRRLAELNLVAGRRAKGAAAYASALGYFSAGLALVAGDATQDRGLGFALMLHVAECEFVTGHPARANERIATLDHSAMGLSDSSAVTRLHGEILVALNQHENAVAVGLDYLRRIGSHWSAQPSTEQVQEEYQRLRRQLHSRPIESLSGLPVMTDPDVQATMEVLIQLAPAAFGTDPNLFCLTVCRMANLSLEHGNSEVSCSAYVFLGLILGPYLGDYRSGFRVATVGLELVEMHRLERFMARALLLFGAHVTPWTEHVRNGRPLLERAFSKAEEVGDVTFAGYCCSNLTTLLLGAGDNLATAQREAEFGLGYAREHGYSLLSDLMTPQLQMIRTLRGLSPEFGRLDFEDFSEEGFEKRVQSHPLAGCWYWIRKLQVRFLAGHHAQALDAALKASSLLWTSVSLFEAAEYHLYAALARAAMHDEAGIDARSEHLDALSAHVHQLQEWAVECSANFENRAALAGAEMARIEGRGLDAMHLYERSIRTAEENGFVHNQALANELAARFYEKQGFDNIARIYLRDAKQCYARWGADGKVRQLDALAPHPCEAQHAASWTGTATPPNESVDLATVIRVSQAIAGETVLDRLVDTLMQTAMEHAGGENALLLLVDREEQRIEARATTGATGVTVQSRHRGPVDATVPESVLRYVTRTAETVILEDACLPHSFSGDPYFHEHVARSVLCLPLINRSRLIGLLYIENNLVPGVFTSQRLAVLKLIALQAAISLENASLSHNIEERESRIRRLVESDVIGIIIWNLDGRLIDANDAFLDMLQYQRSDIEAGLRWFDMTPLEWQEVHVQEEAEELATTGTMRAREKEFFAKDGSRVPVLIGAAVFEGQPDQGVAYILDLTDLKRAEAEARENEQRYQTVHTQLAHANRISTMGQLTGSIAHEVNQPIAATVINAQAALRVLRGGSPDLREVESALDCIVKDGNRAGDIIARIRGLIKNSPVNDDPLDVDDLIREVIALTHGEAKRNSVSVQVHLADKLPPVRGDRVQLQQVMLNLIINALEAIASDGAGTSELMVSTATTTTGVVIVTVRDTGPGLAPAVRESAFEAFYTTKTSGLGMGLSICRSIIEAHGGRIWVSENEPRGAVFEFTLPVDSSAGTA